MRHEKSQDIPSFTCPQTPESKTNPHLPDLHQSLVKAHFLTSSLVQCACETTLGHKVL